MVAGRDVRDPLESARLVRVPVNGGESIGTRGRIAVGAAVALAVAGGGIFGFAVGKRKSGSGIGKLLKANLYMRQTRTAPGYRLFDRN